MQIGWLGEKEGFLHSCGRVMQWQLKAQQVVTRRNINHSVVLPWQYHHALFSHELRCCHKQCERKVMVLNLVLSEMLAKANLFLLIYLETIFFTGNFSLHWSHFHLFGTFLLGVLWKWQCASPPSCQHQPKSVLRQSNLHLDEHLPGSDHINTFTLRCNSLLVK